MTSRFCLTSIIGSLALAIAGCSDALNAGPLKYVENERLAAERKVPPKLQPKIGAALAKLYGDDPQHIKVPEGAGLPGAGIYLANYEQIEENGQTKVKTIYDQRYDPAGKPTEQYRQPGGYSLYRMHCLHCHGVSGAGDGPTAPFLYPRPRDYRKGLFKFTSTPIGVKPSRADLHKTIKYGLHGTSMPAFEALMSGPELEQVIDYVIFLSMRGETEVGLIEEAAVSDENDPASLDDAVALQISKSVFDKWKAADRQVVNPPVPRPAPTRESVLRGRELFLGKTTHKLECTGCHGAKAVGDGPSMVGQEVFNDVVFSGGPSGLDERLAKYPDKVKELWKNSVDDWGNPLRPANLNRGVFKGGRRPIDIYWRIAKGINGAKMPGHSSVLDPPMIWDLVNFVLELPYDPQLLRGATLPGGLPAPVPAPAKQVARR